MKAEGWQQIDKLFQATVELDPTGRAVFLEKACAGNPTLRSEVEALLSADSFEWEFIENAAIESAALLLAREESGLAQGDQLGHYEIDCLIGRGGMGEVYRASDGILNRHVALKLLLFDYMQDADRLKRFHREAQTVSALNHPNILTIHELGNVDGQQFIATELVEGETLRERIKRGPLPVKDALDIAIQIAGALAAAHRAAIIHRDIKPENVMLRPDGYVKVLDFGLSKLAEISVSDSLHPSHEPTDISSFLLMGTPRYMSPEQISGVAVDARSDIFSLGVVLFEMLTGRPPYDEKDPGKLAKSILESDPPALDNYLDAIPEGLVEVVNKMLNKNAKNRYQRADALIADLNRLQDRLKIETKTYRRARVWIVLVVLACAIVAAYATYVFFRSTTATPTVGTSEIESGRWTTKAPISSPRWQAEPAVLNNVLYVAGGWNGCTTFGHLESYDRATDAWTQRAPMRTARGGHGVAVLDGQVYAVGGAVDCGAHISSVEAYDPVSNKWSERASLPTARLGHAVASSNDKLYAIGGGVSDTGEYLRSNTEYDPQSDTWTERAPMPTARTAAAVAVVDGIIYVIGGGGDSGTLSTVEAYNPLTDSWSSRRSMLKPRLSFGASEVRGIIYVFGGGGNRDEVEAYDPSADTWKVVAKMPAQRSQFHAATLDGSVYFAGGSSNGINYLSTVMAFTPQSDAVLVAAQCPGLNVTPKTNMATERVNMTVGEIDGIIYAAGGFESTARFLATNEAYDSTTDAWTTKAPMPGARETRGTNNAVVNGKLYVIGGNARGQCSNLNEAYDPAADRWLTKSAMPTPRCHLAVVALNGLIYALGGTNTSGSLEYNIVEVYNPSTDKWTTAPPMPTGRQDLGAVSWNGVLYAIGGANPIVYPDSELNLVEAYDPISETWTTKAPLPTPRAAMAVGVLNGMIVVAGGLNNETVSAAVEAYDPVRNTWTKLESMPTARAAASAATMGDTLYIFGGAGAEALNLEPCFGVPITAQ